MQTLDEKGLLEKINQQRKNAGYLSLDEMMALGDRGNIIFDPFSTLISKTAQIGSGNQFFPNTRITVALSGLIEIGDGNLFYPNTSLEADTGPIRIGDNNQFGEGGFTAKANAPGATIRIGDQGRYVGAIFVYGNSTLGDGCQILGPITASDCTLASGEPHTHAKADQRGAVLKGFGSAQKIRLQKGEVLEGQHLFSANDKKRQSHYHPTET